MLEEGGRSQRNEYMKKSHGSDIRNHGHEDKEDK